MKRSVILLILSFMGCKESEKDVPHILLNEGIKQWGLYKPGSYWIYDNKLYNTPRN